MDGGDPVARLFHLQSSGAAARRATFGLTERRAALARLAGAIRARQAEIVAALATDFGKPEAEVVLTEILPLLQEIAHTSRHLGRWMRPRRVRAGLSAFGTSAQIVTEPKGTCLIIAPWNYPLNLALGPLISCLAAGNSAILKPSELTPATSALIADIVAETFANDLVAVIEGGKEVAEALLALPFDHIFFTGSPEVGSRVMAAAAKTLASVTLELGGKSPCIIGPGADLAQAAKWIAFGKFTNAGQTCIAPDHVLVHASVAAPFKAALRHAINRLYPGGLASPDLTLVINDRHAQRLTHLLGEALDMGARLVTGGPSRGRRILPTVIEAVTPEMGLDRDEIFGPILPLLIYDDLPDALARIAARPKPLALYVFEKDRGLVEQVIAGSTSGSVGVNLTMLQFSHPFLPFGGVNRSGLGAAHGRWGFRAFSHEKAVLRNRFSPVPLLFPPYTARVRRLIALAQRMLG